MSTPYGISTSKGSSVYSSYLNTPIRAPLSTNQYPFSMAYHNFGVLNGQRPTPPLFYPSQEPVYSDMNTNARSQYVRATGFSKETIALQKALGKESRPTSKVSYSSERQFGVSTHMNYIQPLDSSMHLNIKKSVAVGKSSYKVGLPIEAPTCSKSYYPSGTRSALQRARSGGCTAPKKKGSIYNTFGCSVVSYPVVNRLPLAPLNLSATVAPGSVSISFTQPMNDSGPIINYEYDLIDLTRATFVPFNPPQTRSPVVISGLVDGRTYSIILRAVNENGAGPSSSPVTFTIPDIPLPEAPVLTGVSFKTTDSITITFNQTSNGTTITNYKYSLNGDEGPFIALSPIDITSPVTITGLTANTTYDITLRAVSANGDGDVSNTLTETTYAFVNYETFTTVGTTTWTAPPDVTFVQYLIVGAGGGGGAAYSDILDIGNIPFVTTAPSSTDYWINANPGSFYGYFFRGNSPYTLNRFARITAPQDITPNGSGYQYNRWYGQELVYRMYSSFPTTSNPVVSPIEGRNNISGGGGGGAGGRVLLTGGTQKLDVIPGNTYTIVVGAGGAGGVGGTGTETNGSPGGDSSFDTVVALGGSGGSYSRNGSQNQDTDKFGKGGNGGTEFSIENFFGGGGGGQPFGNNYGLYNSGGAGNPGFYINFDGSGPIFYGAGGTGGIPNTVASGTTPENVGKGGNGTGAELNSYANGIDGGSGIVILRYYTNTPPPATPTLTYALPGNGQAYIYFTKNPDTPAQDITNYEYTIDNGTTWTALSSNDKDTPILITGLTNGTTYNIKLRAVTTSITSAASNAISVTPQAGTSPASALYYDPSNNASYPGTGTIVANIGSFGALDGTMIGTTFVTGTGITRNVFDFNGASTIEFGQYNFGSSFTVSAWVYPKEQFSINGLIANASSGLDTDGFKLGWNFWETENRTMLFEAGNGFQGGAVGTLENTVIVNSWQYLTYIVDVANQRALFLRNGIPVDSFIDPFNPNNISDNTTVPNIGTNNPNFNIGTFTDSSYGMNAELGYIKIYNGILSVGDIQNDYNSSKAFFGL